MNLASIALLAATGGLGVVIAVEGLRKVAGAHVEDFERYGYPQWFRVVTGGLETAGGLGLLAGVAVDPALSVAGGTLVAAVLGGAVATHVRVRDPPTAMGPALALLSVALLVVGATVVG